MKRPWNEKAHEEHFIMNHHELEWWFSEDGGSCKDLDQYFLPPHVLNFFRAQRAQGIRVTDAICPHLPWVRLQGGLILFSGTKVLSKKKPNQRIFASSRKFCLSGSS